MFCPVCRRHQQQFCTSVIKIFALAGSCCSAGSQIRFGLQRDPGLSVSWPGRLMSIFRHLHSRQLPTTKQLHLRPFGHESQKTHANKEQRRETKEWKKKRRGVLSFPFSHSHSLHPNLHQRASSQWHDVLQLGKLTASRPNRETHLFEMVSPLSWTLSLSLSLFLQNGLTGETCHDCDQWVW